MNFERLSLKEKIAQTVIAFSQKDSKIPHTVGGIFVGAQVITEADSGVAAMRKTVEAHRKSMPLPPFFVSDLENGCGNIVQGLTQFPFLMSLGAANDEQLAYNYGKATALEAQSVGIHFTFSPVCDLNKNFKNPLVNTRALTDKVNRAIPMLTQIIKGMQEHGLAACAKHFPGDGIDWRDQHLITTENSLSMEEWWQYSGKVFQKMIDAGVRAVMPGHITLPAYQKERVHGRPLPATLSKELITDLLKGEMGFQGIVVSDATMMGGFNGYYKTPTLSQMECFKAGCDMVLWPTEDYIDTVAEAIETGYIPLSRLNDALERIAAFKQKFVPKNGSFKNLTTEEKAFIRAVQTETAEKSITLLKNNCRLFPLKKNAKKIVLLSLFHHDSALPAVTALERALKDRGVTLIHYTQRPDDAEFDRVTKDADLILYALFTRPFRPVGPLDFWGDDHCWAIAKSYYHSAEKTAYVSFGNPYFLNQYFERANTYVNAYSALEPTVSAFVKALFGEIEFGKYSPVQLQLK